MDGTGIVTVGGIVGALIGVITFLFRALIKSKDETIKALTEERDYWRGVAAGAGRYGPPP